VDQNLLTQRLAVTFTKAAQAYHQNALGKGEWLPREGASHSLAEARRRSKEVQSHLDLPATALAVRGGGIQIWNQNRSSYLEFEQLG